MGVINSYAHFAVHLVLHAGRVENAFLLCFLLKSCVVEVDGSTYIGSTSSCERERCSYFGSQPPISKVSSNLAILKWCEDQDGRAVEEG